METKVILKYKRECDSWICPDCDTENHMTVGRCTVCGYGRTSTVSIVKAWTPADDVPEVESERSAYKSTYGTAHKPTAERVSPKYDCPAFEDIEKPKTVPDSETPVSATKVIAIIIAVLFFVAIVVMMFYFENGYAASCNAYSQDSGNIDSLTEHCPN